MLFVCICPEHVMELKERIKEEERRKGTSKVLKGQGSPPVDSLDETIGGAGPMQLCSQAALGSYRHASVIWVGGDSQELIHRSIWDVVRQKDNVVPELPLFLLFFIGRESSWTMLRTVRG